MKTRNEFPNELLSESKEERLKYFVSKVIAHPKLTRVYDQLLQLVDDLPAGSLIFVYGPTGIGKTTLRFRFVQNLLKKYTEKMIQDPAHIPVVTMEVAVSDADSFSWRDYYRRALLTMDSHFVASGNKLSMPAKTLKYLGDDNKASRYDFRWALEREFAYRTTKIFVADEAQHLKKVASGRRLLNQMDTLKSLANVTQVTHILMGTYELTMDSLSAQLDRRSEAIHFSRYHYDVPSEFSEFKNIIWSFQREMPLPVQPDLVSQIDFLYESSLGCVGILKQLLNRALKRALDEEKHTLTKTILESQSLTKDKLIGMTREIREGEEALRDKGSISELQSLLDMPRLPAEKRQPVKSIQVTKKQKPFHRKPGRDQRGINERDN